MPRVSVAHGWWNRQRGTAPARPGQRHRGARAQDHCVIIRGYGDNRRRGFGAPDVSGPASGAHELRLRLVMIPPGTRGLPHFHADAGSAVYLVSGAADVWHGTGLCTHSTVRAGDFIYIPPGTPHLAVNRGEVTSIAVVTRAGQEEAAGPAVVEIPRHLAGLLSYPVAVSECPEGTRGAPDRLSAPR